MVMTVSHSHLFLIPKFRLLHVVVEQTIIRQYERKKRRQALHVERKAEARLK
jgi:hypothetical protein